MLTETDLDILETTKHNILIKWWGELNSWKWPQELPDEEKPIYRNAKNTRRSMLMLNIMNKVGLYFILKKHNYYMSKKDFNDFWRGTQHKSKKAFRRYIKRIRMNKYSNAMHRKYCK